MSDRKRRTNDKIIKSDFDGGHVIIEDESIPDPMTRRQIDFLKHIHRTASIYMDIEIHDQCNDEHQKYVTPTKQRTRSLNFTENLQISWKFLRVAFLLYILNILL